MDFPHSWQRISSIHGAYNRWNAGANRAGPACARTVAGNFRRTGSPAGGTVTSSTWFAPYKSGILKNFVLQISDANLRAPHGNIAEYVQGTGPSISHKAAR